MKILARYPIAFGAHPGRCASTKTVVCPYPVSIDVPDISDAEVSTVVEAGGQRAVEYDGRLFRCIGPLDAKRVVSFLEAPFIDIDYSFPIQMASVDSRLPFQQQSAGRSLHNHVYHRLFRQLGDRPRETVLYPPIAKVPGHPVRLTRNDNTYEKIEKRLADVDGPAFHAGVAEAEAEARKLLIVGGDLWVETPPPVLSAESADTWGTQMELRVSFLPDWFDPDLGRQYFPLDAVEEAAEYLRAISALAGVYTGTAKADPANVPVVLHDECCDLLKFDHVSYSQQRTALLLGADLARAVRTRPERADALDAASRAAADEALALIPGCGTDWRRWPDVGNIACQIAEGWIAASRPDGFAHVPDRRHDFGTFICRRVAELADATPIVVDTRPAWKAAP